jgi:hypothetical protein
MQHRLILTWAPAWSPGISALKAPRYARLTPGVGGSPPVPGAEFSICDETNSKPSADLRAAAKLPAVLDLFSVSSIGLINNNK